MPLHNTDICEACEKRPDDQALKRCGTCQMVHYCSKKCQKSHWPAHKRKCKNTAEYLEQIKHLPWRMADRVRTHKRWTRKSAGFIIEAAKQAMKLWENIEAIDHTVFVVYLQVEEYIESEQERKITFLRSIKAAKCISTAEFHAMYDYIFSGAPSIKDGSMSAYDAIEDTLADRPGLLRIMVIDECPLGTRTPFFGPLPTDFSEESLNVSRAQMPADGDWLKLLKKRIDWVEHAWKRPIRQAACQHWADKNRAHIVRAGIHALNLRKQSNRANTDIFLVLLDCREDVVSLARRSSKFVHSVRKARAIPADIVKKKYTSAVDTFAAADAVPLQIGERLLQILVVDDDGVGDDDDPTPVVINTILIAHAISWVEVLPPFEQGWLKKFKEITRS